MYKKEWCHRHVSQQHTYMIKKINRRKSFKNKTLIICKFESHSKYLIIDLYFKKTKPEY